MKVETFLPVFPGFYSTIFELDTENFIYYENQDNIHGFKIDDDDLEIDNRGYENRISQLATDFIEETLIELKLVKSIKFQSLYSPKEYNFRNDSINIEVTVNKTHLKEIYKYLKANWDEFTKYVKERHTSYSGFISFHSNDANDWIDETNKCTNFADSYKFGAILDFIVRNEIQEPTIDMYYHCQENIYEGEFITVIKRAGQVLLNEVFNTNSFDPNQVNFECVENGLELKNDILEIFNSSNDELDDLDFDATERAKEIFELVKNHYISSEESSNNYKLKLG